MNELNKKLDLYTLQYDKYEYYDCNSKEKYPYENFYCSPTRNYSEYGEEKYKIFKKRLEQFKEKNAYKTYIFKFFVQYTFENFPFNFTCREVIIKNLLNDFEIDKIIKYFNKEKNYLYTESLRYLYSLTNSKKILEYIKETQNLIINEVSENLSKKGYSKELFDYLTGNKKNIDEKKIIRTNIYEICNFKKIAILDKKILLKLTELILKRKSHSLISELIRTTHNLYDQKDYLLLDLISEININLKEFFNYYFEYKKECELEVKDEINYALNNGIDLLNIGIDLKDNYKKSILESLDENSKNVNYKSLIKYLDVKNKSLLTLIYELTKYFSVDDKNLIKENIYSELKNCSENKETNMVKLLIKIEDNINKLKEIYPQLKEEKSRDIISSYTNLSIEEIYFDKEGKFDFDLYLKKVYKEKEIDLDLSKLNLPIRKDKKNYDKAIKQLINLYKNSNDFSINKEAIIVAKQFEENSLKKFARSIYDSWKVELLDSYDSWSNKLDYKKRWVLLISIMHGDSNLLKEISNITNDLAVNSRHKYAIYIIKSLALNSSKDAFINIDKISRKTRFKSLRLAATEAFDIAVKELNISKDKFADLLVNDLGFINNSISLDYGNQTIKLFLGSDFKFEIEKENGKKVKTLPKGTKDDDENLIKEAKEKFKVLKKDLREMVKLQTNRLKDAYSYWRLWKKEDWENLFLKNPVMNALGKGLLWGIYKENKLVTIFAMDSNLFNSDYEDILLQDNDLIGLIHPLELKNTEIQNWNEIFKDNEQNFLFNQLDKEIINIKKTDTLTYNFNEIINKNSNTIAMRLKNKVWTPITVDCGDFCEFYKEYRNLKLQVNLSLDKYLNFFNYYDDNHTVAIDTIKFYKIDDSKKLKISKIEAFSERITFEILKEIKNIFS